MRTVTSTDLARLALTDRQEQVRVWIADHEGTLIDYAPWMHSLTWQGGREEPIRRGTVTLRREDRVASLAPLMHATDRPIDAHRRIVIQTALVPLGATVEVGDWRTVFEGYTDDADWGGTESRIVIPFRDPGLILHHTLIEDDYQIGASTPIPVEQQIQTILDDVFGEDEVPLELIGDPDWGIIPETRKPESVWAAISYLADSFGGDLRYLWDDTEEEFRLHLIALDRDPSAVMATITPTDYYELPQAAIDTTMVRDRVVIAYRLGSGAVDLAAAETPTPVLPPGRRAMRINSEADPQVVGEARANAFAAAVLGDISQPVAAIIAECAYFWPVEVNDYYRLTPNQTHHTGNLDLAVVSYTHTITADPKTPNKTTLVMRGKPAGSAMRWHVRRRISEARAQAVTQAVTQAPTGTITPTLNRETGAVSAYLTGPGSLIGWRVLAAEGSPPSTGDVQSATLLVGGTQTPAGVGVLVTLSPGETAFVRATMVTGLGASVFLDAAVSYDVADAAPGLNLTAVVTSAGVVSAVVNAEDGWASWKVIAQQGSRPSDAAVRAATAVNGANLAEADFGTLGTADPGEKWYVGAFAYSEASGGGDESRRLDSATTFGVTGDGLAASSVAADKMTTQAQGFTWGGTAASFTLPGWDAISWAAGTMRLADGTSVATDAGNLTAMATGAHYIYFDGTATIKVTTDPDILQNDDVILLGTGFRASGGSGSGQVATIIPAVGSLRAAGAMRINADSISANAISANAIQANAITTGKLAALAVTTDKLSSLSGGGLTIDFTATGTQNVLNHSGFQLKADGSATFSGALSAASGSFAGELSGATGTFNGNLIATQTTARSIRAWVPIAGGATIVQLTESVGAPRVLWQVETTGPPLVITTYGVIERVTDDLRISAPQGQVRFSHTGPVVTGSRDGNAALASLLTGLAGLGLITNSSTA